MLRIDRPDDPGLGRVLLRVLRSAGSDSQFDTRLQRAWAQGYRILVASAAGDAVGVLGFRITDDLCWGRTLFIDDLVVDPARRGQNIGGQLLAAARDEAARQGCDHMRLCSGLTRHDAHRFYEANGMGRFSLQFVSALI